MQTVVKIHQVLVLAWRRHDFVIDPKNIVAPVASVDLPHEDLSLPSFGQFAATQELGPHMKNNLP
jgi:hypothetical protein